MGHGRWDADAWASHATTRTTKAAPTVDHIYKSRGLAAELDPKNVALRESRDSAANPNSTALIVGLDVTGSMDRVLDVMAREGLGTLVGQIYTRKPIHDPHIMVMGIGDFEWDRAPLQITQFEAENDKLVPQMEKIYLERGGGGNAHESYSAAWYFAALHTGIDCFEKRGQKGYLFTVGDEEPTPMLYGRHINEFLIGGAQQDFTARQLLDMVSRSYHVFHVMVEEGNHFHTYPDKTRKAWLDLLGQRALPLSDHTKLAEVVVSAIEVTEGRDRDAVTSSWSGDTSLVVARALGGLPAAGSSTAASGVSRL